MDSTNLEYNLISLLYNEENESQLYFNKYDILFSPSYYWRGFS
jgi:hypothetical protein